MSNYKIFGRYLTALPLIFMLSACGGQSDHDHSEEKKHSEQHEHSEAREHSEEHAHSATAEANSPIQISQKTADEVGIRVAAVSNGVIRDMHEVQGLLTPIEGRHARIRARFPGPVKDVHAAVGDSVKAGQTLATVESNVSLSDYAVTAPFSGTLLSRSVSVGDLAGDEPLFELAELSTLWVDLHLFGSDALHITPGLPVRIVRLSDGAVAETQLDRILPGTATASQSTVARATLRNTDGRWRPGTAVRAQVTVAERAAALVVPLTALQNIADDNVVFVRNGDAYLKRKVRLGQRDAENAEVLDGLQAGEEIVVEQSYLIKADIEKAGATHAH